MSCWSILFLFLKYTAWNINFNYLTQLEFVLSPGKCSAEATRMPQNMLEKESFLSHKCQQRHFRITKQTWFKYSGVLFIHITQKMPWLLYSWKYTETTGKIGIDTFTGHGTEEVMLDQRDMNTFPWFLICWDSFIFKGTYISWAGYWFLVLTVWGHTGCVRVHFY